MLIYLGVLNVGRFLITCNAKFKILTFSVGLSVKEFSWVPVKGPEVASFSKELEK